MVDRVPWAELEPEFLHQWGWPHGHWQPEHLSVLGPTGSGKSYFYTHVLDQRTKRSGAHAVILVTKPADSSVSRLTSRGWKLRRSWPPEYGEDRVIFWPPSSRDLHARLQQQKRAIYDFLQEQWKANANVIMAFDEIAYLESTLGLRPVIEQWWREARSQGITLVATTQRPRNVSRFMHSETTWVVAFRPDDEDDAKRVAEILGNRRKFTDEVLQLEPYEFLITKRRTREAYISRLPS